MASVRGYFGLSGAVLQEVKRITQREKHSFQSGKHNKKAIVDAEEQSIVESPFSGRRTRLHRPIKTSSRQHKQVQQQAIEADPEDYPKEGANAGEQPVKAIVTAAERHK